MAWHLANNFPSNCHLHLVVIHGPSSTYDGDMHLFLDSMSSILNTQVTEYYWDFTDFFLSLKHFTKLLLTLKCFLSDKGNSEFVYILLYFVLDIEQRIITSAIDVIKSNTEMMETLNSTIAEARQLSSNQRVHCYSWRWMLEVLLFWSRYCENF